MTDPLEGELVIFDRPSGATVGGDWNVLTRTCADCGDEFTPKREKAIRCASCQVADDDALDDVRGYSRDDLLFGGNW